MWHRAMKFITCLECKYAQNSVDWFCENVALAHYSEVGPRSGFWVPGSLSRNATLDHICDIDGYSVNYN